jgi:hypothetical protein
MSTKISQLTSAADVTASDLIQIVDVEDGVMAPSGTNKKITASLLAKELAKQPLEPGIVISGSSSGDAVRITQTGSGNALVVEDSANPDSTPFVVDPNGRVVVGDVMSRTGPYGFPRGLQITNVGAQLTAAGNNQFGEGLTFVKSRGTPSSPHTIVQNGDSLGSIAFTGSDGSDYVLGSQISSFVDGTPGSDDMPSRLTFSTSADGTTGIVERMRITSAGNVGIGTATPGAELEVADNNGDNDVRINLRANASTISQIGASATQTFIDSLGARPFIVFTNAVERMRIDASGNVGIGTGTPSSKLHVAGDLTMSSATVATSATAGTNGDVPAQVEGYLVVNINGTARKIPYYA